LSNSPYGRPLVTIVTPSYNQGRFIDETILSVLDQDYPHIEYIVVDGGSTDQTLDILKKYEGRLRWVSERDHGQADAINKGFSMATGDILAWLNSDDTYLPGAVSRAVSFLTDHQDIKMVYGKAHYSDETGRILGEYPTEPFDCQRLAVVNFICQPSTFVQKEAFIQAGGLDSTLQFAMDYDLWIRIVDQFKVEYLPEVLSIFRLHSQSKTISELHALKFNQEILNAVLKYYKWAPANRVYGYCYHLVQCKAPPFLGRSGPVVVLLALTISIVQYLRLNKSIRLEDIKSITLKNLRTLFSGSDGSPRVGNPK
jgi:glycosyltransferase involved in cell wall biosynthesis